MQGSVSKIEQRHKGLILGGNLRDGIGMAQRITQATTIARMLADQLKETDKLKSTNLL